MTAEYLPGERWLVVTPAAMACLEGTATDALRLWRALSDGATARVALDVLVRTAMDGPAGSLDRLGAFLLAVREPDGLRVLCRDIDDVAVRDPDGATTPVVGAALVGWAELLLAGATEVTVGRIDPDGMLPVPGGVVRADAVRWTVGAADIPAAGDAEPGADQPADAPAREVDPLPPLPEPAAVPAPPPFVPASSVLPPVAGPDRPDAAVAASALEETRFEVAVDPADDHAAAAGADPVAGPPGRDLTGPENGGAAGDLVTATGALAGPPTEPPTESVTEPPMEPPTESVTGLPAAAAPMAAVPPIHAVPPAAAPISGAPPAAAAFGDHGDHDGLTQLAEDLPIGYTPPPAADEMPVGSVLAVLCAAGHANAPHSSACRLCGQPIVAVDPVPVPRPVLARIRLSTGDVVDLDRPVVLGRAPYASRVAASELPRLVTVPSPNQDISRAHVQIRGADWQIVVADLDSTNGTTVRPPGRAPQRLHPGQEIVVATGWSVELGDGISAVIEAPGDGGPGE